MVMVWLNIQMHIAINVYTRTIQPSLSGCGKFIELNVCIQCTNIRKKIINKGPGGNFNCMVNRGNNKA